MADTRIIQEQYIRDTMCRRIEEFSTSRNLRLRVGTFNVNGKSPEERLSSFIGVKEELPDMFVFGFQELDLSTEAFLYLSTTEREDAWCNAILEDLGDASTDYIKVIAYVSSPKESILTGSHPVDIQTTSGHAYRCAHQTRSAAKRPSDSFRGVWSRFDVDG